MRYVERHGNRVSFVVYSSGRFYRVPALILSQFKTITRSRFSTIEQIWADVEPDWAGEREEIDVTGELEPCLPEPYRTLLSAKAT